MNDRGHPQTREQPSFIQCLRFTHDVFRFIRRNPQETLSVPLLSKGWIFAIEKKEKDDDYEARTNRAGLPTDFSG